MKKKPGNLDDEVRGLLDAHRGRWPAIVESCGVSHSWISKFVRRRINNPQYGTLVRLREHLESEKQAA